MFLRNKITGDVGQFANSQGADWEEVKGGNLLAMTLAKLKAEKIEELQTKVSEKIYRSYSIPKQISIVGRINGYTDEDFDKMNEFITPILAIYHDLKEQINLISTRSEIEQIDIENLLQ